VKNAFIDGKRKDSGPFIFINFASETRKNLANCFNYLKPLRYAYKSVIVRIKFQRRNWYDKIQMNSMEKSDVTIYIIRLLYRVRYFYSSALSNISNVSTLIFSADQECQVECFETKKFMSNWQVLASYPKRKSRFHRAGIPDFVIGARPAQSDIEQSRRVKVWRGLEVVNAGTNAHSVRAKAQYLGAFPNIASPLYVGPGRPIDRYRKLSVTSLRKLTVT